MANLMKMYMDIAEVISKQSKAKRLQVGALLVKGDDIISFGYNGTARGLNNTCENDNLETLPDVIHAELNIIIKMGNSLSLMSGSTLYITDSPCAVCAAMLIQSRIESVVYKNEYRDTSGIDMLRKSGINVTKFEG